MGHMCQGEPGTTEYLREELTGYIDTSSLHRLVINAIANNDSEDEATILAIESLYSN